MEVKTMAVPVMRLVNHRYRGPMESRKVNQMMNDIRCDIERLESFASELALMIDTLAKFIIMGESIDARETDTVSQ